MRRRRFRPKKTVKVETPAYRINERIPAPVVFVIDENGVSIGEMPTPEAILRAKEVEMDLVEVSPKADPPVCRIADFGKIQYQKTKEKRVQSAGKKKTTTKGVRLSLRTGANDLAFKQRQADGFLVKGHKVRAEIFLRGREKAQRDAAKEALQSFCAGLTTPRKIEEDVTTSPRGFQMTVAPE